MSLGAQPIGSRPIGSGALVAAGGGGGGGTSQALAVTLDSVTVVAAQTAAHSQSLAATLDSITAAVSQASSHAQSLTATLDSVVVSVSQLAAGGKAQALAITLDDVAAAISQKAVHPQALAATLDDVAVAISQTGAAPPATGGGGAGRPFSYREFIKRLRQEHAQPLKAPKGKQARKRVRGIEVQAAEAALAGAVSGEDSLRELMAQWLAAKPVLPESVQGRDEQYALFLGQVAFRLRQIEQEMEYDDEEALLLFA